MEPSTNEKQRKILTLAELARAMRGAANGLLAPEFVAEGTQVNPGVRASVPPRPRRKKKEVATKPRRPTKLVVGLGVVEAKNEVAPEMVRSGPLDMQALAEAYQKEGIATAVTAPEVGAFDAGPRFADPVSPTVAALMLPPLSARERSRTRQVPFMLAALLGAALIVGTAAATVFAMRSERPAAAEEANAATPPRSASGASEQQVEVTATPIEQMSDAPNKVAGSAGADASPKAARTAASEVRKRGAPAPAAAKSCGEQACLLKPSLACCKESAAE